MAKRIAASILWFMAIWFAYELAWSLTEVPRAVGPVLAAVGAALVGIDPLGVFWPRLKTRTSAAAVVDAESDPVPVISTPDLAA